jgi:hypothetical protein
MSHRAVYHPNLLIILSRPNLSGGTNPWNENKLVEIYLWEVT